MDVRVDPELGSLLSSPLAVAVAALLGAIWGSFFNVVIARVPRGESIVRPPSRCFACGRRVRALDNIPVLSYFILRGRCRACGARFSPRYLVVELLGAALAAAVYWKFVAADPGETLAVRLSRFVLYFGFAGLLQVLSFIDLDTKRLPDIITIPSVPILYAAGFAAHDFDWKERAIGAAVGYLVIRLIADFYYYVLRREGIGLGDAKLLALIGATLGWRALPITFFTGGVVGSLVSLPVLIIARRRAGASAPPTTLRRAEIPFGPFLAIGALVYLFAGREIVQAVFP